MKYEVNIFILFYNNLYLYAPSNEMSRYVKQLLTELKG